MFLTLSRRRRRRRRRIRNQPSYMSHILRTYDIGSRLAGEGPEIAIIYHTIVRTESRDGLGVLVLVLGCRDPPFTGPTQWPWEIQFYQVAKHAVTTNKVRGIFLDTLKSRNASGGVLLSAVPNYNIILVSKKEPLSEHTHCMVNFMIRGNRHPPDLIFTLSQDRLLFYLSIRERDTDGAFTTEALSGPYLVCLLAAPYSSRGLFWDRKLCYHSSLNSVL